MPRLTVVIVTGATVAVVAMLGAPTAFAGFEVRGPVVAHGHSPHGMPWKIKTQRDRSDAVDFEFDVGRNGYFTQLPLPIPRSLVFSADTGTDLGHHHESDISGLTARRVFTLVAVMNDGRPLRFHPSLAPRRLRQRFSWLHDLRFFDRFYATDRRPRILKAYDGHGHLLLKRHTHLGLFVG